MLHWKIDLPVLGLSVIAFTVPPTLLACADKVIE